MTGLKPAASSSSSSDRRTAGSSSTTWTIGSVFTSLVASGNGGEGEAEHRPTAKIRFAFQETTMRLDDRTADREAEPHTVGFCRDEWLEKPIGHLFRKSRPAVGHCDLYRFAVEQCRRHLELAPFARCHRLERVTHQIDEDLLDLNPVAKCPAVLRAEAKARSNTDRSGLGQRQAARLLDHCNNALYSSLRLTAADEVAQPTDDLPGA